MDNCPDVANTDQLDGLFGLGDGVGDACDDDDDNDGDYNDVALFARGETLAMPSLAMFGKKATVSGWGKMLAKEISEQMHQ